MRPNRATINNNKLHLYNHHKIDRRKLEIVKTKK